jgi:hypothetical protein
VAVTVRVGGCCCSLGAQRQTKAVGPRGWRPLEVSREAEEQSRNDADADARGGDVAELWLFGNLRPALSLRGS